MLDSINCTGEIVQTDTIAAALESHESVSADLIVCSAVLSDGTVLDALAALDTGDNVLVLAGPMEQALAVEACFNGANFFITKDQNQEYLRALQVAIEQVAASAAQSDMDAPGKQVHQPEPNRPVANDQQGSVAQGDEHEVLYRQLVEHMGEGLAIADVNDTFIFANPAAEQMLGLQPGGLVGRNLADFLDEEGFEVIHGITNVRRDGITSSYEVRMRRADGVYS